MNDAATVMGRPKPLKLGNEEYLLHPLSFDDHGDVQRWLDDQIRDPLAIVSKAIERGNYPSEIQKFMVRSAIEIAARSRILLGTPEADALLDSLEGKALMLHLSIRKGRPTFTYDQAMDVLRKMDEVARAQALAAADVMRSDDPKAGGTDGSASPAPPDRSPSTGGAGSES